MKQLLRRLLACGALGVAALVATPVARADFDIQIFADAGLTVLLAEIHQGGPGDNSSIATEIDADKTTLNTAIIATGLQFTGDLIATSNATTPNSVANLTITGQLIGAGSLFIVTSADSYTFPAGPTYLVGSSASHTFTEIAAGTSPTFTSYFNQSNTLNARETATGTLIFAPPPGTTSIGMTAPPLVVAGSPLYSLTNVTGITLTGNPSITKDGFSGTTTVRAVPEPGALALFFIGGSALVARQYRRRKSQV